MLSPNALQKIATLPALRGLAPADRDAVAELFEELRLPRGHVVFKQGDPGDALYIVVSGAADVVEGGDLVTRMVPGEWFGEMALLTGAPRSATVEVALDCHLLVLREAAVHRLLDLQPGLYAELAEILSRRLSRRASPRHLRHCLIVALENRGGLAGRGALATEVADALEQELGAPVPLVTLRASGREGKSRRRETLVASTRGAAPLRERVAARVADLAAEAPCVLLELDEALGEAQHPLLELADVTVDWSADPRSERPDRGNVVQLFERDQAVQQPAGLVTGVVLREAGLARSRALASLARRLTGRSVGLALGSGAAYGLSHVGVLEELVGAGVPIDFLSGASIGSVVGALYALGTPPAELRKLVSRLGDVPSMLRLAPSILGMGLDFNLLQSGMFSGDRFARNLGQIGGLGEASFADLDLPFRAVATDVDTGARVELDEGPLVPALRASCSAPWVFSPAQLDGRMLIDGGMCDPVPSDTVRDMGADRVIAVNVVPSPDPRARSPMERALGRLGRVNPLARRVSFPNSFDVVARTLQIMQHELGNVRASEADHLICPDLGRFWLLEFWAAPALIEEGARAAAAAAPEILKQLAETRGR